MEIVRNLEHCPGSEAGHVLTIGVYDGVHLGHQAVIRTAQETGLRLGVPMAVVTFDPHPAYLLRPESAPPLLTDLEQKLDLLEDLGVDKVVVVPFDHKRSSETAEEFVEQVIVQTVGRFTGSAKKAGDVGWALDNLSFDYPPRVRAGTGSCGRRPGGSHSAAYAGARRCGAHWRLCAVT